MPALKKDHPRYEIASFRCTEDEKIAWAIAALKSGVSLGTFLRTAADKELTAVKQLAQ